MKSSFTVHIIGAGFALLIAAPVIYMALDRDPPYKFVSSAIVPPAVRQGEEYAIWIGAERLRDDCQEGLIYREYVDSDGKIWRYDPIQRKRPPEIQDGKILRFGKVPLNFPPGKTVYRGEACYPCNALQRWIHWPVCIKTPEAGFEVLPGIGGIGSGVGNGAQLDFNVPPADHDLGLNGDRSDGVRVPSPIDKTIGPRR